MSAIYFDSTHSDEERRERLYRGDIYVFSPNEATLGLCEIAQRFSEEAFAPHPPELAQNHFDVAKYAEILGTLKPKFIHDDDTKKWIKKIMVHMGCDSNANYFDVPRLRTSTSHGYLTNGIAYAFHPHRDTWYSAPSCQINWWMPVCAQQGGNVMAFHERYFDLDVPNTSSTYDYYRWNKLYRRDAAKHIGKDTRVQPHATVEIDASENTRIVTPVGGMILFSGAHLHSSVENNTGRTRLSIDFRTVNVDDAAAKRGAPMGDVHCTGTNMRDFLHLDNLSRIPEDIVALHDSGDGSEPGELIYDPDA